MFQKYSIIMIHRFHDQLTAQNFISWHPGCTQLLGFRTGEENGGR